MPSGGALRLAEFNGLPATAAHEIVLRCVSIKPWATALVARRPYRDRQRLLATARELTDAWTWADVEAALDAWPFLDARAEGARVPAGVVVAGAEGTLSADLSAVSEAYQERFGRSLVVGASGRTTSDVLRLAVRRLLMDEAGDRSATTAELRQISLRRLRRMIL
ncbi:MAG TPA: 2-oxo-4-hydroxy-4-carboxy-5-ureidoimidazoline decarboxylase [Micropruina sp.]|jgi:OHCU decarboxylase|nr:2-oxo-4-hydroxy-4-carboxy-5-ureidoimidazoline decarboxylase [Micropruina sp.]